MRISTAGRFKSPAERGLYCFTPVRSRPFRVEEQPQWAHTHSTFQDSFLLTTVHGNLREAQTLERACNIHADTLDSFFKYDGIASTVSLGSRGVCTHYPTSNQCKT